MTGMRTSVQVRPLPELLRGFVEDAPMLAVTDVGIDSRQIAPGGLFLACRGTRDHGLSFLPQALARGAAAVAWEPAPGVMPPDTVVPAFAVENLARHAGEIAARFFGRPADAMHCIGVTGTDGKTSTAFLLAQALEQLDTPCLYVGTLGAGRYGAIQPGDQTTPDPVSLQRRLANARAAGTRAVAMEVSSHALDQARVGGVQFHTAVLTNVGRDHLDYHGTIERYAEAKMKLFFDGKPAAAVLNRDDERGRRWAHELSRLGAACPALYAYGIDGAVPGVAAGHYLLARNLSLAPTGIAFDVETDAGHGRIESRLLGRFNVSNLLAALGTLRAHDVALDAACAALSAAMTVPGRIEGFRGPRARPLVVVDYAHTPQALAQVLQALRAHCAATLWCVFGCGGDRDRGKRPLMGAAAAQYADRVIVTDDNPRSEDPGAIVREIQAGFSDHPAAATARVIHDRAQAIDTAVSEAGPGDVVVVAGKGHEDYQLYGNQRRSFSDRQFVSERVGSGSLWKE
jgi:UDP-N-acetylmuramoyl-L-alanyl-D-glutamate--2,6-diaminopimelate ligase